jgi:hypothetical protein
MARAVVLHLRAVAWGRTSMSLWGTRPIASAAFLPYGPSKAAIDSETIIRAQELAGSGVRATL